MSTISFKEKLRRRWAEGAFLCIGLDSGYGNIPVSIRCHDVQRSMVKFNRAIIDATWKHACAFKFNPAFYFPYGVAGWEALRSSIEFVHNSSNNIPVILDGKFGDVAHANEEYARMTFDVLKADAVTVNPFAGQADLEPFLQRDDKGIFVLSRTSGVGYKECQDNFVDLPWARAQLYELIVRRVASEWNERRNCGIVVGVTRHMDDLRNVRRHIGDNLPILIPGIGAQGGDPMKAAAAGVNAHGDGIVVSASRSVIYASRGSDFAQAAAREAEEISEQVHLGIDSCRNAKEKKPVFVKSAITGLA